MRIEDEDRRLVSGGEWADGGQQGEGRWRQGWGWLRSMTLEQELDGGKMQGDGSLLEHLLAAASQRGRD